MKRAGLRQARQTFAALINDVRLGREVEITDRGRPVARLVPVAALNTKPFRGLASFRRSMPRLLQTLSQAVIDEREEDR